MEAEERKTILLKSAVRVAARNGLENATTKAIGKEAELNEAYIYRLFRDKDDLLSKAYIRENDKLMKIVVEAIEAEKTASDGKALRERTMCVLKAVWKYLTENPEICKFLVYYYHSPGFGKYAVKSHKKWLEVLTEKISSGLQSKVATETMLYMSFTTVYGFAKQAADGMLPNTPETEERVLENIYTGIAACYAGTGSDRQKEEKGGEKE